MKQVFSNSTMEGAVERFRAKLKGPRGPCNIWDYKFRTNQIWYKIISRAFNVVAKRLWNIEVEGLENIPAGNVIFMPNHVSHLDGPLVSPYFPSAPVVIGDEKLFRSRWFAKFSRMVNIFPVRKAQKSVELIDYAIERVEHGDSFLIFPEGQRHKNASINMCNPGKLGAGKLAQATSVPVIPIFIEGAEFAMALGKRMTTGCGPRSIRIRLRFGKPVELSDVRAREPSPEVSRRTVDRIMMAIEELRPDGPYMVQKTRKWQKPSLKMFRRINNISNVSG